MIKRISQSFTKDMLDYQAGELCGNMVKARWVDDRLFPGSDAMALGAYFEYQFTLLMTGVGTLPKDGKIPMAKMMVSGKDKLAPYRTADANVRHLKDYFEEMGLKIVSAGKRLTKGRFDGTLDLICEVTKNRTFNPSTWNIGDKIIIDLKYSGLLDDKWNKMGWAQLSMPGPQVQKDYHRIQATQYSYIGNLPFYYLVMSSTNETDIRMFDMPPPRDEFHEHLTRGNRLFEDFEFGVGAGFTPYPEISRCNDCPLKKECPDKHTFPHPIFVV